MTLLDVPRETPHDGVPLGPSFSVAAVSASAPLAPPAPPGPPLPLFLPGHAATTAPALVPQPAETSEGVSCACAGKPRAVAASDVAREFAERRSVAVAFAGSGVMLGSWAGRIPAVSEAVGLTWGSLGGIMLIAGIGSLAVLQYSPLVVSRDGTAVATRTYSKVALAGLIGVGVAPLVATRPTWVGLPDLAPVAHWGAMALLCVSLLLLGAGLAVWDVALNVEGGRAPRATHEAGEPQPAVAVLLPLHGSFSVGAAAGAGLSALAAWAGLSPFAHLVPVALSLMVVEHLAADRFRRGDEEVPSDEDPLDPGPDPQLWRFVGFGLVALVAALAEVVGNDWIALVVVDANGRDHWAAGMALGVFTGAMACGRFAAALAVDRLPRRLGLLRLSVLLPAVGAGILFVSSRTTHHGGAFTTVLVGAAVWGLGASVGVPWAMHAAAAVDRRFAAVRVRTVQAVSNLAFLSPGLVGWVASRTDHDVALRTVLVAMAVVAALAVLLLARGPVPGTDVPHAGVVRSPAPTGAIDA